MTTSSRVRWAPLAIAALLAAAPVRAGELGAPEGGDADPLASLLSLRPPVAGYSSVDGLVYEALPVSFERCVFGRWGLRLSPTMVAYRGAVQGYGLIVAMPVYSSARSDERPYGGAYAAPLIAGLVDRLPTSRRMLLGGAEGGYAWTLAERWRLSVGLWYLFDANGFVGSAGGLTLALGRWL